MSAISSALSGSGISQYLQSLTQNKSTTSNSSTGSLAGALGQHHRHGGGGELAKIADAITSALQQTSNGSGGTVADANQTITSALTKLFTNGSLGSTTGSTEDADGSEATTSTSSIAASGGTTTASGGLPAEFVQTLKSFGVTSEQFQADLSSAIQSAQQTGKFDPSSLFKNFPAGSLVDAVG